MSRVRSRLGVIGAFAGAFVLSLGLVPLVSGDTKIIDLTTAGSSDSYNGAYFKQGPLPSSAGTGVLDPFLRVSDANSGLVQGYNTDYRPLQYQEDSPWTESLLLSTVPTIEFGGTLYRAFFLDINQVNSKPDLSLDDLRLYLAGSPTLHNFNPAANTFDGVVYTPVWTLSGAWIHLDYSLESGSGASDMTMLVPESTFAGAGASCQYGQAGCTSWLYFYNKFGVEFANNDGFEEWATQILPYVQLSKDAAGSFDRTYDWTIDKSGTPTVHNLFAGGSGTTNYSIPVDQTITDGNIKVTGTITITVPAKLPDGEKNSPDAVVTSLDDLLTQGATSTGATITGCATPFTVKAGSSKTCAYTISPPTAVAGTNTVTAVVQDNPTDFTYSTGVTFTQKTIGYPTINVTDKFGAGLPVGLGSASADKTFTDSHVFTCSTDPAAYTNGFYSYQVKNVATITETGANADETVTVNCYAPVPSKTAVGTFDRHWDWTLDKTGDQTSLTLAVGQTFQVNYQVVVTAAKTDSNYKVTGVISVTNPHPSASMDVTVADAIGATAAVINCGSGPGDTTLTVAHGATGTCSYVVDFGAVKPAATTNTTTVTFNSIAFTASHSFGWALDKETDECITVTDTKYGSLGTVCAADSPKTIKYSLLIGPFAVCGPYEYPNTASFVTNDTSATGSDSWKVLIDVPCLGCTLTQGYWKTHSEFGPAPYDDTWALLDALEGSGTPVVWAGDGTFDKAGELFFSPNTSMTWHTVFWTSPAGNAYYQLAHQYEAAVLNILNEASAPSSVTAAIAHAEALFEAWKPADIGALKGSDPLRKDFISTASILASYNQGTIGPGHCDEDRLSSKAP